MGFQGMPNFLKSNDKRAIKTRKRILSGLVALLAASPLMADKLYIATKTDGKIGSLKFKNEDILQFDTSKNEWSILFDGSDVGLAQERIDGFYVGNDYVLLSLAGPAKLDAGGAEKISVRGSDIVKFNWDPASSPGDSDTKGTFELFFDGSDVGVKRNIDAVMLDHDGNLVFSLNGKNNLPQSQGQFFLVHKQDLVRFIGNTGPETSGYFEFLFDGRKAGFNLKRKDIDGADLGEKFLYLVVRRPFHLGRNTGYHEDILRCDFPSMPILSLPVQACDNPQVVFNGSDLGLAQENLQDIQIVLSLDFSLNAFTVAENQPAATTVGSFTASNVEAVDTITYTLVAGEGDTDNASFTIVGDELKTAASFDFETKNSYSIRVRGDVSDGRFFEKQFTITVQDANDAPTDLVLSSASVDENQALGAVVGSFASTDPDSGDTHTYTLIAGAGDTDNASFEIVGNELKTAAVFDFETKNSYSIRVRSTDSGSGGLTFEKSFTITVGNGPDAPTDITLTPSSVDENEPSGTEVGDLASTDSDAGDTHTYTLVAGAGDTDNSAFAIEGNKLKTAASFDFETKNSYSIRLRSTDSGGRFFEKTLTVTVTDVNDGPSVTAGGTLNYSENSPAAAIDPALTVSDQDSTNLAGATVSISSNFHSGQDVLQFSDQNGITGSYDSSTGVLTLTGTATLADYQTALRDVKYANTSDKPDAAPRTVTWVATDGAASSTGATSTITIVPVNDAPVITGQSDLNLSMLEDGNREIVLADLVVTDPDNAYPAGFTLTVGDGANYTHIGNTITPAADFTGSLTVPVVVNDGTNDSNSFNLTVTVVAVNDAPVVTPATLSLSENSLNGSDVGTVAASDIDLPAQSLTYAITAGNTGGAFAIDSITGQITVANGSALDFETTPSFLLTVTATDNGSPSLSGSATITVNLTNVNEAPTAVDDAAVVDENGTVTALTTPPLATQVTVNDSDPDAGNILSVTTTLVTGPAHASAFTLNADGRFSYTHDGSETTTDSFTYELCDSEPLCDTATVTITINSVNDAPVITDLAGDTLAYSQNEPARVIDQGDNAGVSDVDSTDFDTGTLTVSLENGVGEEDVLGIRNQGDAAGQIGIDGANVNYGGVVIGTFSGGTGGADLVVTFNASADAEAVSALLRNITYRNSNMGSPDLNNRTAHFVLADGDGAASVAVSATITVSLNTPPELTAGGGSPSFTEDGGTVVVDSGLTVTDANDTDLESATVTIANIQNSGNETLAANTAGTSITASYSAPTLTLTGTDTVAHYQQVLRSVTYSNGSQNPDSTARSIDFKVNDGSIDSNTVTTTLTVVSVNDAPSLTAVDPPAVLEDAGLQTVNDWATFNAGTDESAQSVAAYIVSDVSNPGLFSTPPAVAADGTLTYTPAANANGTSTFKVAVQDNGGTANGGVDTSTAQTFTITVTAVNDAPVNTVPAEQSVNEDTELMFSSGNGNALSVTDIDAGANTIQVTVSALNGTITPAASGASLSGSGTASATITGTLAQVNSALNGLKYKGNANFNATRGSETLTIVTNDQGNTGSGGALSDTDTVNITVNAVNDAPSAVAKSFNAQANMEITGLTGLLTGATDPDTGDGGYTATLTVGTVSGTTPAGGTISNLDTSTGTFDFDPPPGVTGDVTFTYTVCDTGNPDSACSAPATATVNVAGPVIWFVDSANGNDVNGKGTLAQPYKTIAKVDTVDSANHRIFLYSGTYADGIALNSGEWLIGQGLTGFADFDSLMSITPPAGTIGRPNLATGTATVQGTVALATNANVKALAISTSGATQGMAGSGGLTGVDVSQSSIATATGTALSLNNVSGALALTSVSANGAATGIDLTNVGATVTVGGGAISNTSTAGVSVNGGAANFSYAGTISNSSGRTVQVQNRSGGTVTFSGALTGSGGTGISLASNSGGTITFSGTSKVLNTAANTAVTLSNNTGATINFSNGGLDIDTTSGTGFNATGGAAAINVTGSGNSIVSTTGTALNVASSNIGADGLTFQSISAGTGIGSAGVGISLNSTGLTGSNGGLTVTGTGTAGSGGTIQHKTGADDSSTAGIGIFLKDTKNASFSWMQLNDFDNSGIVGRNVQGFTLQNSVLNGVIGSSSDPVEGPISFGITNGESLPAANGLQGTGLIRNVKISGGIEHNVEFYNQSGSMSLTIDGSSVVSEGANPNSAADDTADCIIEENSAVSGSDGILIEMQGTATATVVIDRCLFRDNKSQAVQIAANDSSAITATIDESWTRKFDQGNEGFILSNGSDGDLTAMISNNHVNNYGGTAIFVGQTPGNATASSLLNASIINNVITMPTDATNHGIIAFLTSTVGEVSQARVRIDGNSVTNNSTIGTARGILVDTPDTSTSPGFQATVTNNSVAVGDNVAGVAGIVVQARQSSDGCANIGGNTVTFPNGTPDGVLGLRARQANTAAYDLEQSASCTGTAAAILTCRNPSSTTEVLGTLNTVSAGTCLLPATP
jgi:VCBS repeat-containing protein